MTKEEVINYCECSVAIGEDDDSRYHNEILDFIIEVLKQEPKTAHWINLKDTYGDIVESVCSNCDYNGNYKWKYCSNCGAKMESEEV